MKSSMIMLPDPYVIRLTSLKSAPSVDMASAPSAGTIKEVVNLYAIKRIEQARINLPIALRFGHGITRIL